MRTRMICGFLSFCIIFITASKLKADSNAEFLFKVLPSEAAINVVKGGIPDSLFKNIQIGDLGKDQISKFFLSKNVDFLQIQSTITDNVKFAIVVYKPHKPSPILMIAHGWHESVTAPTEKTENPYENFLTIQVDMRGRKYSSGNPDCNGYELYDFYDAYRYVVKNYRQYISDTAQVYFSGGSGGGGNGYEILGKFPDLFCSAVISCGISDYSDWYRRDSIGEFRDEMSSWIGCTPDQNPEAYQSRSGIISVRNLLTPVYIIHGETDVRVPVTHARNFYNKAKKLSKDVYYLELKNVGTRNHWGNITPAQEKAKTDFNLKGLEFRNPPKLPEKGKLIVPGYVVTKEFSVFLRSIDSVGLIKYDTKKQKIKFLKGEGDVIWN